MTMENEKMFEENKNLIYATINTYVKCPGMYGLNDYEDLFQIGSIALCNAIEKYDPSKGKFATYAVPIIRNMLYNALRNSNDVSDDTVSLDEVLIDIVPSDVKAGVEAINENNLMMDKGLSIIDSCAKKYGGIAEKGAQAIKLMLLGYDCNDIAAMYDVEAKTVTAWMSRARKKLQKEPELLKLLDMA